MPVFPIILGTGHLTPTSCAGEGPPSENSKHTSGCHSLNCAFCKVATRGREGEGEGNKCLPWGVVWDKDPQTKDRPLKYIEKCSELGWVVVGFLKGKIASLIKEIVWFFWPVLLRKRGNGTFPWTVSGYGAQGYCGLRTQLWQEGKARSWQWGSTSVRLTSHHGPDLPCFSEDWGNGNGLVYKALAVGMRTRVQIPRTHAKNAVAWVRRLST